MSSGAALATVTALIRWTLQSRLPDLSGPLGEPLTVSALPPDRIETGSTEASRLNLFLYRVAPNPGWRNADLPARAAADGVRLAQPPLALDLHYLLSAYGGKDLQAEILLGYAMEALHGMSLLTRRFVRETLALAAPAGTANEVWQLLGGAGLADQAEVVSLSLAPLSTDEIAKLWSVLGEKYRVSAAYVASTVLITPQGPARPALPVTAPALALGSSTEVPTTPDYRPLLSGDPAGRPAVGAIAKLPPAGGDPALLAVDVTPTVQPGQQVRLLLNRLVGPGPEGFVVDARAHDAGPADTVRFAVPAQAAGSYLVRVEVDDVAAIPGAGADGRFDAPVVTLP